MAGDAPFRVLKYGLVQDGKIIEEYILGEKEGITLGTDTSNTISVAEGRVPRRHRLIEPYGNSYKLTLFEGIEGKVSVGDQIYSIPEIESSDIISTKGNYTEVKLAETSKGKLVLGRTTILFQLVPPPPPPPILKLPKELRASIWSGFDLFFLTVILLSALFHLSLVTYLSSLEVTDTLSSIDTLKFIKPLVTTKDVEIIEDEFKDDEELKETKAKKPAGGGGGKKGGLKDEEDKGVESKGLIALITKHGGSGSVADILSDGIGEDLTSAIDGVSGVDVARGTAARGTRGDGGSGGGGNAVDVGGLASYSSKGSVKSGMRVETKVKSKISGASGGVSGKIDQASVYSVIRRRLGGVRYCYESQLKTNPSLAGKIRVQFTIGSTGGVSSCTVVSNSMGNAMVQECVCRMVRRWKFPEPEEGTVTVGYTFIFSSAG